MKKKHRKNFFNNNKELLFGVFLIIIHAVIWFVPAYTFGSISCDSYKFIYIFPLWFVYSVFGSFIVVVALIITFILFNKILVKS